MTFILCLLLGFVISAGIVLSAVRSAKPRPGVCAACGRRAQHTMCLPYLGAKRFCSGCAIRITRP